MSNISISRAVQRYQTTGEHIDRATAREIASWWASPGTVGRHLAAYATGAAYTYSRLEADVNATIARWKPGPDDKAALEALLARARRDGGLE